MEQVNEHLLEILNILQEECAEVIQAASKIKRFGILNRKEGDELNNLQNLELELGDVLCLVDILLKSDIGLSEQGITSAKLAKSERLKLWSNL